MERRVPEVFVAAKYPRPRIAFSKLLAKYGSEWVIDIHNAQRNYPVPTDENMIATISYSENYKDPYTVWEKVLEPFGRDIWDTVPRPRTFAVMSTPQPKTSPRFMRVELFPYIGKEDSIEFIEELSKFLQKKRI